MTHPAVEYLINLSKSAIKLVAFLIHIMYLYCETLYRLIIPLPLKSLKGQVILITGTANGIGRAICLELATVGATLVCWDLDQVNNQETLRQLHDLGAKAYGYSLDISNKAQVAEISLKVKKDVGDVTTIINNAGLFSCDHFLNLSHERIEKLFEANVFAHFWILKEFLPAMMARNEGHIVSVASGGAIVPTPYTAAYAGTKGAVISYMDSLRLELLVQNSAVKVTTVYPSASETGMLKGLGLENRFSRSSPFLRIFSAQEVAKSLILGFRRGQDNVYIPGTVRIADLIIKWIPARVCFTSLKFFDMIFQTPTMTGAKRAH